MKKILLLISLAVTIVSCENVKHDGYVQDVELASKQTKDGIVYGTFYRGIGVPPTFHHFGAGITSGTIYFSNDKKVAYLFESDGTEVLTGRKCNPKKLDFEPVPILTRPDGHKVKDRADYYYGNIFCRGDYYLLPIADGTVYAAFTRSILYDVFGPYKKFFPGCSGYMYQDIKTGKWGAVGYQVMNLNRDRYLTSLSKQDLFAAEYDEIIEVVKRPTKSYTFVSNQADKYVKHVWFARKGDKWSSYKVNISIEDSEVSPITVDQQLLNRVRSMKIRTKAQGRESQIWVSTELVPNQRIGTKEASVVFL